MPPPDFNIWSWRFRYVSRFLCFHRDFDEIYFLTNTNENGSVMYIYFYRYLQPLSNFKKVMFIKLNVPGG